jgi:Hypothetical protein (DUF2513)
MKREWELVRLLMLWNETDDEDEKAKFDADIEKYPEPVQLEHIALLIEAGLLEGEAVRDQNGNTAAAVVVRVTWAGHDFLAAMRNDEVWNRVTRTVKRTAGSVTVDILKELLQQGLRTAIAAGTQTMMQ